MPISWHSKFYPHIHRIWSSWVVVLSDTADSTVKRESILERVWPLHHCHTHFTSCYVSLSYKAWRQDHKGVNIKPKKGDPNCDTQEMISAGRPWFRFSGAAGNHLMNKCVPFGRCSTEGALWSDDLMPSKLESSNRSMCIVNIIKAI